MFENKSMVTVRLQTLNKINVAHKVLHEYLKNKLVVSVTICWQLHWVSHKKIWLLQTQCQVRQRRHRKIGRSWFQRQFLRYCCVSIYQICFEISGSTEWGIRKKPRKLSCPFALWKYVNKILLKVMTAWYFVFFFGIIKYRDDGGPPRLNFLNLGWGGLDEQNVQITFPSAFTVLLANFFYSPCILSLN